MSPDGRAKMPALGHPAPQPLARTRLNSMPTTWFTLVLTSPWPSPRLAPDAGDIEASQHLTRRTEGGLKAKLPIAARSAETLSDVQRHAARRTLELPSQVTIVAFNPPCHHRQLTIHFDCLLIDAHWSVSSRG